MMKQTMIVLWVCIGTFALCGCGKSGPQEISRVPYSDGHCILRNDGMVVIECSGARDMLPVTLVSTELVEAFADEIESRETK